MSVSGPTPGIYVLGPQAPELALALLMLRGLANYHHAAFAADDFALFANWFYGRFNFHNLEPPLLVRRLFRAPSDAPFC